MTFRSTSSRLTTALAGIALIVGVSSFTGGDPQIGTNIGNRAPELAFKDPEGTKVIKLSDLKGKYVLVRPQRQIRTRGFLGKLVRTLPHGEPERGEGL
jgi:hypothetical protein